MLKVSTFLAETEYGYSAVPLFGPSDGEFEKRASPHLLPPVLKYIENLRPQRNSQYVLVNALAAGEYFGSNINGDNFPEAGLIHCPQGWTGNPTVDMALSKDWAYGFPSFYNAHPFAHHRNKDPSRAYGAVELALWNDVMKRVELVVRVDYDKCQKFGGIPVWDKLKSGAFPDVSMGCLPSGSLITMSDGTQKPIELVRETEMVLTHTGAHRRVTDTMRRHHPGSVFRFNVYGFRRELVVTGNHPLWLVDGEQLRCDPQPHTVNKGRKQRHCTPFVKGASKGCSSCSVVPSYEFEWRRADEAQVGDYLAFPVPTLSTSGALQGNRSLARLLGYYLAEGHVSNYNDRPREQVNFSLNYEENELAEEIEKLARSLGVEVLWHHEKPEVGSRTVSIVSKTLASLCSFHCGDGAKTKVLSQEVLHEDPALLLELLGAYLNGDGGTYKGSLYFSTSSEQLAHQLFIALARCGLVASVNKNDHKPSEKSVVRKETTEYQVWVGTDFSWKLERYISKPVRHSIKVRGQRFFYNNGGVTYLMAPILEIDEAPHDADVFNFSVEGDESYVAEGLAVHNSKVPYDTSSITLDWKLYREAQATFDLKKHKHPGMAVLEFHKKLKAKDGKGIPGLSVTRDDYDSWCRTKMNKILPDGRKVFVYNDYPRFFDISFVFIGADRTAKTMVFISQVSVKVACDLGYVDHASFVEQPVVGMDKAASASDEFVLNMVKEARQGVLYHGSSEKREVLTPHQAKGNNAFQNQKAVYAATEPLEAKLYAVGSTLKGKTDYAITPKDKLIVVGDDKPKAGYLHVLPADDAVFGKGKANGGQAYVKHEVEPTEVKKVTPKEVSDRIIYVDSKEELKQELAKDTKEASASSKEYRLVNPNEVFLPHEYSKDPRSASAKKVQQLSDAFVRSGYDPEKPPTVGYPVEGKVQILDGGSRAQAAAKAGILLPVTMVTREGALAAKGTPEEGTYGHTDVPLKYFQLMKEASADDVLAEAFGLKSAELKRAEIDKDVVPSQMAGKAIPVLNRSEPDLPSDLLRALASRPEDEALSTSGALGIILRPREFQKITLIRMGHSPLAHGLEDAGVTFPKVDEVDRSTKLGPEKFSPALAKALEPMMGDRSMLGPVIERRIVMISMSPSVKKNPPTSHSSPLLRKIGAAYNGYRAQLMEYVAHTKDCLQKVASTGEDFDKLSSATPEDTFTPLSYCYLRDAFLDELGVPMSGKVVVEP